MNIETNPIQSRRFPSLTEALSTLSAMDQECILVRHRLNPGETIDEHFHALANEWVIGDRGLLEVSVNGNKAEIRLGGGFCAVSFPAGSRHALKALSEVEYFVLRDRSDKIVYTSKPG